MNLFWYSQTWVQALGGALAHSIWQGAAAAALLALILPRFDTASKRCHAAFCALMSVFLMWVLSFWWYYAGAPACPESSASDSATVEWAEIPQSFASVGTEDSAFVSDYYPWIVTMWLLGFLLFVLRRAQNIWQVRRLRQRMVMPATREWQMITADLAARFGVRLPVQLFESACISVPVVLGYLRPVILFPFGLLQHLRPEEAQAVLAHELAHIARRDWLFHLVQYFLETLFYYHPAVWWISSVIRQERERSCDDYAVAVTGDRLAFVRALLRVAEYQAAPPPALALSFHSRRRPLLLERVQHILQTSQPVSCTMEKTFVIALFLAILAVLGLYSQKNNPLLQTALAQTAKAFPFTEEDAGGWVSDTLPPRHKGKQKITRDDGRQRVELELKDGAVTRLNIDGKEIPDSSFAQYRTLVEDIQREAAPAPPPPPPPHDERRGVKAPGAPMPPDANDWPMPAPPAPTRITTAKSKDGYTVLTIEKGGEPVELIVRDGAVWKDGRKLEEGETVELLAIEPEMIEAPAPEEEIQETETVEREGFLSAEQREDIRRAMGEARREARQALEMSKKELRAAEREMKNAERRLREEARVNKKEMERELLEAQREIERVQLEAARAARSTRNRNDDRSHGTLRMQELASVLVEDGLIDDPDNFTFELREKKLEVNGKKQSDATHEKYLEWYYGSTGKKMKKGDVVRFEVQN